MLTGAKPFMSDVVTANTISLGDLLPASPGCTLNLPVTFPVAYNLANKWATFTVQKHKGGAVLYQLSEAGGGITFSGQTIPLAANVEATNEVAGGDDWDTLLSGLNGLEFALDVGDDSSAAITEYRFQGSIDVLPTRGPFDSGLQDGSSLDVSFGDTTVTVGFSQSLTDSEIAAAYQTEVPLVSQAVAEAGTSTSIFSWSAERVKQAIAALGGGGGAWGSITGTLANQTDLDTRLATNETAISDHEALDSNPHNVTLADLGYSAGTDEDDLVQLTTGGALPAVDGSNLTGITASASFIGLTGVPSDNTALDTVLNTKYESGDSPSFADATLSGDLNLTDNTAQICQDGSGRVGVKNNGSSLTGKLLVNEVQIGHDDSGAGALTAFKRSSTYLDVTHRGASIFSLQGTTTTALTMASNVRLAFAPSAAASQAGDTAITRVSAGLVAVGDAGSVGDASGGIRVSELQLLEKSADPSAPSEGNGIIWMSDGTGSGDDGDVMITVTAGASTKTGTLFDHSAA
ncbi:MAG TPA: hypothetical protein DCG72_12345 [Gammaproteobacteria bacterium]|nr:hypothetical protein [Gammaproteobacteria bacterium]